MAEGVADRPPSAGGLQRPLLPAKSFEADGVVAGERLVVPTNRPADLRLIGVDAARGVVGRADANNAPVVEPADLAQPRGHQPDRGPHLAFELEQVQFANAAFG